MTKKYYVYLLISVNNPKKTYVGFTADLNRRVVEHNSKTQIYSKRYATWGLITYIVFTERRIALEFEKYLKKPSGKGFIQKHLI